MTFTTFDLTADHQASLIGRPQTGVHISSLPAFISDLVDFRDQGTKETKIHSFDERQAKHSATSGQFPLIKRRGMRNEQQNE